jgi:hypothetical protein
MSSRPRMPFSFSAGIPGDPVVAKTGIEHGPDLGAGQVLNLRKAKEGFEVADLRRGWK